MSSWWRKIGLPLLVGLAAALVALNVSAFFGLRMTTGYALWIAPPVEEACAVMALATMRAHLKTALVPSVLLMFGLGYAIFEFVAHVAIMQRAMPPFPALVVWLAPFATVLFHISNATVAAWFIIRLQSLPGFLICLVLHATYNAYAIFGFATLPPTAQVAEVILRIVLLCLAVYFVLSSPSFEIEATAERAVLERDAV